MPPLVRMTIIVTCVALFAGCSRERQDWQSAQTADTIEAYDAFIAKHRDSVLVTQAQERMRQLGEERDWQQAATLDTPGAYQAYLRQHPDGKWAGEARIRIENFALAGASPTQPAGAAGSAAAVLPPSAPPSPAPAATRTNEVAPGSRVAAPVATAAARAGAASAARHAVQFGAFSSEARAMADWKRLAAAYPSALAGLTPEVTPVRSGAGTLHRLRAAVGSEAQARGLCATLRANGQACIVVLPVGK